MKRPALGRFQHALLAPHIAPKSGASPAAAAAILEFQEALTFAGWSKAEAQAEIRSTTSPRKENAK